MSLNQAIRAWISLPPSEQLRFLRACYWLSVCAGRVRRGGLPGLASYIESRALATCDDAPDADLDGRIAAWHRAVGRASRVLPSGSCLEKAATLQLLLAREGIATALKIGVLKNQDSLQAHAWLERDGAPVLEWIDPALQENVFNGPWTSDG